MNETLDGEPVNIVRCIECTQTDETCFGPTINFEMRKRSLCFTCLYWIKCIDDKDQPTSVRVKGSQYTICDERAPKPRGFGGAEFTIVFFDGNTIESHNLWCQGPIPERFRDRLPDNASFR